MKYQVFFIIVIVNLSNNGKAALDNFVSLKKQQSTDFETSCYRPCKLHSEPKRCFYKFQVRPALIGDGKEAIVVNGITPGPPVHVCVNDVVVVEVQNEVPGQDISIHWSGIDQKKTPFMDGVPMITQCPIRQGAFYRYAFIASKAGTFFYHADSVTQQSDGVYGSLIVNEPKALDPHSKLYDYDRSVDNTLIIGVRFLKLLTGNLEDNSQKRPLNLLINGDQDLSKIFVLPGFSYKLRLINAISLECPVRLRIEKHVMTVIATDGNPVKPVTAKTVLLFPGERMDVVVSASQVNGGYWIKVDSQFGVCAGLKANAMFLYSGYEFPDITNARQISEQNENVSSLIVTGQMLESLHEVTYTPIKETVYLSIDKNLVKVNASDIDFQYIIGALRGKPAIPVALLKLKETGLVQINEKNFLYPNFPMLLYPQNILGSAICEVGKENLVEETQCVQTLNAKYGQWIELALVNEGFGGNDSYTFHLHGQSMIVLETWAKSDGKPLSKKEYLKHTDTHKSDNQLNRILKNPVIKDTVTVPNKGYVIIRIKVHAGSWMLECRACSLILPTAIVIHVPLSVPKTVLESLPKCGTYKPPDVLLN